MKVSRFNLKILEGELDQLQEQLEPLRKAIKSWSEPMWQDVDYVARQRYKLEKELTSFRERMALIYDFMGDRGLADFIPTSIRNEQEAQREPFPEESDVVEVNGSKQPVTIPTWRNW
jgi:hypothetical protein